MTRPAAAAATLLILLLALPLLSPSAAADHAYSHRYVVFGRVVDAEGAPVAGAEIVASASFPFEGPCDTRAEAATDAWDESAFSRTNARGEFWICFHAHHLPADRAYEIRLDVVDDAGETLTQRVFPADPRLRVSFVDLLVPEPRGGDAALLAEEHLVAGRVWGPWVEGETLDGVPVQGLAVTHEPVEVRIEDGARTYAASTTTNGYGDFAVRLPLDAPLSDAAKVVVEHPDGTAERAANATGWTTFTIVGEPRAEFILIAQNREGVRYWQLVGNDTANPTLRVLPNARVSVVVVNAENASHTFQVEGFPAARALTARGDFLTYNFTAPESGTLRYLDAEHPEMAGDVRIVTSGAPPTPLPTATPTATPPPSPPPTATATATPTATPAPTDDADTPAPAAALALVALALVAIARRRGRP